MTRRSSPPKAPAKTVPRRGRPPGGSALSQAAIVEAAVAVIEGEGVDAVSLRSVARRLGVDAKSLYHHIASKDALLDAVAEHVLRRMVIAPPSGDLRADLLGIARAFRAAVLSVNREAATLIISRPVESLASLAPLEAALTALLDAGAEPEWAVRALRTMLAFIAGSLLREASTGLTLGSDDPAIAGPRETALAGLGYASLTRVAPHLSRLDHTREFEFGAALLVDAFARHLQGGSTGKNAASAVRRRRLR